MIIIFRDQDNQTFTVAGHRGLLAVLLALRVPLPNPRTKGYLIPREIDSDPFRLRGVWQPHMRGPILEGELGQDPRINLPGLDGGEHANRPSRGEGIIASGGRDKT